MGVPGNNLAALVLAAVALLGPPDTARAACGKVTIAEMTWGSAAVAAHVERLILARGYGCDAELVPGDSVPTVTSMSEKGQPDLAPEIWINSAREIIDEAVAEGRLVVAGEILADGGEEGWWVPAYLVEAHPELITLQAVLKRPDLFPDKEEPGKGRFYGCPAGWACQIVNQNLFEAYGLEEHGFTLFDPGSGEGLAGAIAKAHERREPMFTYYWAPTAVLGKYPMVKLGGMKHDPETWDCVIEPDCPDPKPNMYPKAVVLTVTTTRFAEAAPQAFAFVSNVSWSNRVVNALLAWKERQQATAAETAAYFIDNFKDVWTEWVPPDVAANVQADR